MGTAQQQVLEELARLTEEFSTAPSLDAMPRRTLADKDVAGPTSAHVIEEIHTPLNFAYTTFTTGSTAFQNIVGVTWPELPERAAAGARALRRAGACPGDRVLLCYAPLGNVFSRGAFDGASVEPIFLPHSSRDAFLVALCREKPRVVVGESSFLRVALEDAKKLGIWEAIPEGVHLLCAGTPLDMELLPLAEECGIGVHDLYGCQEFGWLVMDGAPLRDDLTLVPDAEREGWAILVAGGLPTGDSFPMGGAGHVLNADGPIHTYARQRTTPELEVVVRACTAQSEMTLERACRSILRIKGRIVRPAPGVRIAAETNELALVEAWPSGRSVAVVGDQEKTKLFDCLLEAQEQYQATAKSDPLWMKGR